MERPARHFPNHFISNSQVNPNPIVSPSIKKKKYGVRGVFPLTTVRNYSQSASNSRLKDLSPATTWTT